MDRKIISFFTFGLLLITIGGIGSFFDWDKSMIFIGLGLTMESLALLIFAWKRLKKR
ncbi:hypothetical protein [Lutimonas sp.]|jgi:hypothetical protein|uniref:hypothetical protein n=1 Tax=Lutimonas sp. TaxID=1872403 RepID=UPI003C755413